MTDRQYKAYIFKAGSTSLSTANVDFTVGVSALAGVPTVRGGRVRLLEGRVEASPFEVLVQDSTASGFVSHLADAGGRLTMVNRFVQLLRSDAGGAYAAIGGGRLTDLTNADNIAQWKLTVSQEWPTGAQSLVFTTNTTHLYPPCADPGGTRVGFMGNPYRYGYARIQQCTASSSAWNQAHPRRFYQVTFRPDNPPMNRLGWDAIATDHSQWQTGARGGRSTAGAFQFVRFNVRGTDYRVCSFVTVTVKDGNTHQYVPGIPAIADDGTINDHITKMAPLSFWVAASSTAFSGALTSTGLDAFAAIYDRDNPFLHMMGARPSENTPLHIWTASTAIAGYHPMQVLKNILDGVYSHSTTPYQLPLYSTAAFSGTADLRRVPMARVGYRITAPAQMEQWVEENLCAPYGVLPTQDVTGAIRFKNFNIPVASTTSTGFSTGSVFQFTAATLRAPHPEWRANRAEACTQIDLTFQNYGMSANNMGAVPGADGADNIKHWTRSTSLYHDRLQQVGTYAKSFKYLGRPAQSPTLNIAQVSLGTLTDVTSVLARNVFGRFGDGPVQGTLHALESAATVAPGDVVGVTLGTYPNLKTNARGGTRLVQILSKSVLPDGYDFDYLDVGAMQAASTKPTFTLARSTDFPKAALKYTLANVGSSGRWTAYLAMTSGSAPAQTSTLWHPIYSGSGNGSYLTPGLPSGTYFWGRANVNQPGRVASLYAVSTAKVTTSGITAPGGYKTSAIKNTQALSTWVVGDVSYPVAVYVDNSTAASPSTANLVAKLGPGTQKFLLSGLDSTHKHRVWVRHYDMFGGYSQSASSTFTTLSGGVAPNIILPPPAGLFTIVGTSV